MGTGRSPDSLAAGHSRTGTSGTKAGSSNNSSAGTMQIEASDDHVGASKWVVSSNPLFVEPRHRAVTGYASSPGVAKSVACATPPGRTNSRAKRGHRTKSRRMVGARAALRSLRRAHVRSGRWIHEFDGPAGVTAPLRLFNASRGKSSPREEKLRQSRSRNRTRTETQSQSQSIDDAVSIIGSFNSNNNNNNNNSFALSDAHYRDTLSSSPVARGAREERTTVGVAGSSFFTRRSKHQSRTKSKRMMNNKENCNESNRNNKNNNNSSSSHTDESGHRVLSTDARISKTLRRVEAIVRRVLARSSLEAHAYPVFDMTEDELSLSAAYMLWRSCPRLQTWHLFGELVDLVEQIRSMYGSPRFHSFRHVFDVMQMMYILLTTSDVGAKLTDEHEGFQLLLACLCHDMGHNGSNNTYLVKTNHKWVSRYGRSSTMERHHATLMHSILKDSPILRVFPADIATAIPRNVEHMIIGTDMELDSVLVQGFQKSYAKDPELTSFATRRAFHVMCVKVCDVSNLSRPFELAGSWSLRLAEEIGALEAAGGDNESWAETRAQSMTREERLSSVAGMSKGFIERVVEPLVDVFAKCCPEAGSLFREGLASNKAKWATYLEQLQPSSSPPSSSSAGDSLTPPTAAPLQDTTATRGTHAGSRASIVEML